MLLIYPAMIHDDADGLWIEFPDLPGCQSQADTLQELLAGAAEALACYALSYLENGKALPQATKPALIPVTDKNAYITLIQSEVELAKNSKSVKKTLTIPAWLNERALRENINFSSVLQNALLKELRLI